MKKKKRNLLFPSQEDLILFEQSEQILYDFIVYNQNFFELSSLNNSFQFYNKTIETNFKQIKDDGIIISPINLKKCKIETFMYFSYKFI